MRCGGVHELELVPTAATIDLEIGKADETRRWELRVRAGENCPRGSRSRHDGSDNRGELALHDVPAVIGDAQLRLH